MNEEKNQLMDNSPQQPIPAGTEAIGEINIAPDIIATLAGITTMKIAGITGMAGIPSASLSTIMGKREINKGVKVDIKDKTVSLEISVVIDIDTVLIDVAKNVQREVKKVIENKTGMIVNKVDVNIREVSYKEKDEAPA